ncbi:uncharacterized protein LOC126828600 [Patella vulgata]|uniref:uncharacterized protein LOC126828600 n=1 Tax=Patella vulgata TaxID=6465 RepID=UPI0024A8330E|nr:uncharacterized protein LOC126828600 [Patella vulgata]
MADDPGHKVMLYFLEVLMYSNVPLTISQLAGRFGGRSFTPEMRTAAGGNEAGLKKFLLKYPSLFTVNGNLVSLNDGTASLGGNFRESSPASSSGFSQSEVSVETEAVQFFRGRIVKREETWVPIKSLAGHLSQAPAEIRECVGPQNEFREWLLRHPLIFDVKEDLVSLKDNITYSAVNPNAEPIENLKMPSTRPDVLLQSYTPKIKRRPKSLDVVEYNRQQSVTKPATSGAKSGPITMTANEYKAVMFVKSILEKKGEMRISNLSTHINQAPESLRNTIGWNKNDITTFIVNHQNIFTISGEDLVSANHNTRLNVIITGSRPQASNRPTVQGRKGKIYHVAKLWGIIDLGKHEHVFIDRTIFGKSIDDLSKVLKIGEMVCFDAIPAPKGSRAKWRAIKVWKENESIEDLLDKIAAKLELPMDGVKQPLSPVSNIDEEMQKFMPELNDAAGTPLDVSGIKYAFSDAAPSAAGVVPVWNFKHVELEGLQDVDDMHFSDEEDNKPQLSMVAERYFMNRSVLGDNQQEITIKTDGEQRKATMTNGTADSPKAANKGQRKMIDVSCQTITTGDVLATQLFHENI